MDDHKKKNPQKISDDQQDLGIKRNTVRTKINHIPDKIKFSIESRI